MFLLELVVYLSAMLYLIFELVDGHTHHSHLYCFYERQNFFN
jgi:hypothetical protein